MVKKFCLCKNERTDDFNTFAAGSRLSKGVKIHKVQYPFSQDEHAAMARYLSGIRRQLQDASDLLATRYGKDSSIAEIAVKSLVSATLLEHELMLLESYREAPEERETLHIVASSRF